jgi:hypothetical protein
MNSMIHSNQFHARKPYEKVGAGELVSSVWKQGCELSNWRYRFNVCRMSVRDGRVSRLLRPSDLASMVKLCQVLAATLAADGCMPAAERRELTALAAKLDEITGKGL